MKTYPFVRALLLAILCLCLPLFVFNGGDALAQKQSVSEVDNLREMLKDKDPSIRKNAAQALAHIGPEAKAAIPALTETLKDKDGSVRGFAAQALGNMGPEAKAAVPALTEATQSKNYFVRQSAVAALQKISGKH
jgi:HEAT repeat protein